MAPNSMVGPLLHVKDHLKALKTLYVYNCMGNPSNHLIILAYVSNLN
jgi:hypothetical protein